MSNQRFKAVEIASNRPAPKIEELKGKLSEEFAINVFTDEAMRTHLSKSAYKALKESRTKGTTVNRDMADEIAAGMMHWALSKGVTHYCHWFQPLTGATAEKHDSFFEPAEEGYAIERFSGNALVQQEPDASSFPSGGLRNTFEARGYTAWDPSSPAFILDNGIAPTLCIPTIFVSYTGEALDYKAPLLKTLHALEQAAVRVCRYFEKDVNKVHASLGIEQEYFLIDEALFYARPDLVITGRTLFGYAAAKGQQLEDHYFGSIPDRVLAYMAEVEIEAIRLGIPLKTRHNEVAPGQFECAPMFEEVNLAIDHNQLLMDLMEKIAKRHKLKVLLHEKPFAGVNGSGKHNNWSLITDTGVNLLSPGKTPNNNLQFLTFFINVIKAVYDHADLLRASIASAGNEHRLGANEAPPSIISIFVGSQLTQVLHDFDKLGVKGKKEEDDRKSIRLANKIPEILRDNTDRNRTSPFAFTGNKFEFRAVGSSANSASPMVVLNAIMAYQLTQFANQVDALVKKGTKREEAIITILQQYYRSSQAILFEGNGYSDEWAKEAEKRGLSNVKDVPSALDALLSDPTVKVFESLDIMSKRELEARQEILLENYTKKIQIESRMLENLAFTMIIPTSIEYLRKLAVAAEALDDIKLPKTVYQYMTDDINELNLHITQVRQLTEEMVEARKEGNHMEEIHARSRHYHQHVKGYFDRIRYHIEKLERMVEDSLWPVPKYREILYIR